MKKCIGIISWLPDGNIRGRDIRTARINALNSTLLFFSKNLPNIPIIIIALCWGDYKPPEINNKLIIYNYKNKLGILKARTVLRLVFLDSEYDYLIMSDDDINIDCNDSNKYLELIDLHPAGVGMLPTTSLIMFAISKEIYSKILIPIREPYDYFEDNFIIAICKIYFKDQLFSFEDTFVDHTLGSASSPSTWWGTSEEHKISKFMQNTQLLISSYKPL